METTQLRDGTPIPLIGFGTYPLCGEEGAEAIAGAIDAGYRLIDTAAQYGNEDAVGAAIRASGVARDELLITTKLAGRDHGADAVRPALERSLENLGLDRVDLWLIHWPNPSVDKYVESFEAMLKLRDEGLVGAVGVSNFKDAHLIRLHEAVGEFPAVNQIQLSPLMQRKGLRQSMRDNGVVAEAWGPLGHREGLPERQDVHDVAAAVGKTPSQVLLRWHVQHGIVAIPKSADRERQRANLAVFDFELDEDAMRTLDRLDQGDALVWDADEHEEF